MGDNLNGKFVEQFLEILNTLIFKNGEWTILDTTVSENGVFIEKILTRKIYRIYKATDLKSDNSQSSNVVVNKLLEKGGSVEVLSPSLQRFNENKFWFVVKSFFSKIKLNTNEILVEKDSQRVIIQNGQYLNGGAFIPGDSANSTVHDKNEDSIQEFVYLNKPQKEVQISDSDNATLLVTIESNNILFINVKPIIRFYFNLRPNKDGIIAWANYLSNRLDKFGIPYKVKYQQNLENYDRRDAGVLYVAQNHFNLVAPIINEVYAIFKENTQYDILRNDIPFFTREIFPGIGFAEDCYMEDSSVSFGMFRSRLLAQKIIQIDKELLQRDKSHTLELIKTSLISDRYNLEEFFRNKNTNYEYDFGLFSSPIKNTQNPFSHHIISLPQWGIIGREKYLKIAQKYANELCERAIWLDSDTCTWITYDEKDGQGFYRLLTNDEKRNLRYFLFKVSDFSEEKEYYQKVALASKFVSKKQNKREAHIKIISTEEDEKNKITNEFDNTSFILDLAINSVFNLDIKLIDKSTTKFTSFTEEIAILIAEYLIEKFENVGLPLRNKFNNYNYCPTFDGRLYIGFMFLVLYKPVAFPQLPFKPKFSDVLNEVTSK